MKTDKFTKILLLIIAVCLIIGIAQRIPSAKASREITRIDIISINGKTIYDSLPVTIKK